MYKVFFENAEIFQTSSMEDAVAMGLNLHRASNVPHVVKIYDPMNDDCLISFFRKSDPDEKVSVLHSN